MQSWYINVFRELLESDVRFIVVGGIAINLLGIPRFTADLDLVVALDEKNAFKFVRCMTKLGYKPKVSVAAEAFADEKNRKVWAREKNMRVFSFYKTDRPYELVDVFVKEPIPFSQMWKSRERIRIDNINLPVVSMEHMVRLKKEAGRAQDISDIEALEKLKKELSNEKRKIKRS